MQFDSSNGRLSNSNMTLKFCVFMVAAVTVAAAVDKEEIVLLEPAENGYLFEGDMVMSKEQIKQNLKGGPLDNAFGLRKSTTRKWIGGVVPFTLHSTISGKAIRKSAIRRAMESWEEKTCIKFKPRTDEEDYLEFFADFGKCYSHVGRSGGKQRLSLGFGCFTKGIAIHEIGHALGLLHEQSRPDRDDYVEILWDNIQEDTKYNFRKYSRSYIDSLGSPYDYDSIMHYEWNAFAKFPLFQRTIRAKKSGAKFGQRSHISVQDAIQINKYYGCNK